MPHFDSYFTIGTYVFSFLLGGVVIFIANFKKIISKLKELEFPSAVETSFIRIHSQLDEILTEMRIKLDSCRSGIVKFHNGGHFFDGTSILKFTTTHESCELGIVSTLDSPQGQLLTRYIDKIKLLEKDDGVVLYTSDLKDSCFKGYLESRSTVAFSILPLYDEKGLKLGYVIAEWCDHNRLEEKLIINIPSMTRYYKRIINSILIANRHDG